MSFCTANNGKMSVQDLWVFMREDKYAQITSFHHLLSNSQNFKVVLHGTMDLSLSDSENKTRSKTKQEDAITQQTV